MIPTNSKSRFGYDYDVDDYSVDTGIPDFPSSAERRGRRELEKDPPPRQG